jgi:hypothetical protein
LAGWLRAQAGQGRRCHGKALQPPGVLPGARGDVARRWPGRAARAKAPAQPLEGDPEHTTQQAQINALHQREHLEHLQRAQDLHHTQRQLDQLRH